MGGYGQHAGTEGVPRLGRGFCGRRFRAGRHDRGCAAAASRGRPADPRRWQPVRPRPDAGRRRWPADLPLPRSDRVDRRGHPLGSEPPSPHASHRARARRHRRRGPLACSTRCRRRRPREGDGRLPALARASHRGSAPDASPAAAHAPRRFRSARAAQAHAGGRRQHNDRLGDVPELCRGDWTRGLATASSQSRSWAFRSSRLRNERARKKSSRT